ncbi:MAG: SIMPL domain-containing protein [Sphingomonadales bacterium]|nr:SIMPL domain-containing protein [Sphingomonadales bacterium]
MKSLFAAALAATTLMVPAMCEAQEIAPRTISGTRLDLQARGESRVTPDVAVVSAGVLTQSADAGTAMRDNAARMTRVLAALKAAGIADKDIQTQSINLSPQYRYANNETPVITGYQANNTVTVRFRDIGKSGAVLDALVKQGANQINGPTLTVESPEASQDAARLSAMKILRARAELYAKAASLKVGRILQLSESVDYNPVPMPVMARMASADGGMEKTSIAAGEQGIGVTVNAVFELN